MTSNYVFIVVQDEKGMLAISGYDKGLFRQITKTTIGSESGLWPIDTLKQTSCHIDQQTIHPQKKKQALRVKNLPLKKNSNKLWSKIPPKQS